MCLTVHWSGRVDTAGRARRAPARMHGRHVHQRPGRGRSIQSLDATRAMAVNVVHFDTSRLTLLGWSLFVVSWASLILLFVLIPLAAPRPVVFVCAGSFFGSMILTAILDYAGDAIHRPKRRVDPTSDGSGGGV
jgi:hypothetical protein